VKETLLTIGDRVQKRYADAGLPPGGRPEGGGGRREVPPSVVQPDQRPPLCLRRRHPGPRDLSRGENDPPFPGHQDQLLDLQLLFYEELIAYAVANPRSWVR
jgi:hypothetical protein